MHEHIGFSKWDNCVTVLCNISNNNPLYEKLLSKIIFEI